MCTLLQLAVMVLEGNQSLELLSPVQPPQQPPAPASHTPPITQQLTKGMLSSPALQLSALLMRVPGMFCEAHCIIRAFLATNKKDTAVSKGNAFLDFW